MSSVPNLDDQIKDYEVKVEELKDPTQDKFLFCIVPDKIDKECIGGMTLKNGVRILAVILLYEALYSFMKAWDSKYTSKFIFRLILGLCYLCISCLSCYSTFNDNLNYSKISFITTEILFILEFLYYLFKSFLRVFEFVNPWDGDFLNLRNVVFIVGDLAYFLVFLYFIYVQYCYIISIK